MYLSKKANKSYPKVTKWEWDVASTELQNGNGDEASTECGVERFGRNYFSNLFSLKGNREFGVHFV